MSTRRPCQGVRLDPFPSCVTHLNGQERARYEERKAEQDRLWGAPLQQYRARLTGSAPACWNWPVTRPESAQVIRSVTADTQVDAETTALDVLRDWQAGRCAVCGREEQLVTDHDHKTGLVRGLLCYPCNTNEGLTPQAGTVYGRYRDLPPVGILGVRLRYWDPYAGQHAAPSVQEDSQCERNPLAQIGKNAVARQDEE